MLFSGQRHSPQYSPTARSSTSVPTLTPRVVRHGTIVSAVVCFRLPERSVRSDHVTGLQLCLQLRQRENGRVARLVVHPSTAHRKGHPVQANRDLIARPGVLPDVLEFEPETPDLALRLSIVGRRGFHMVHLEVVDVQPYPDGTATGGDVHPAQDLPAVEALDHSRGSDPRSGSLRTRRFTAQQSDRPGSGSASYPAEPFPSSSNHAADAGLLLKARLTRRLGLHLLFSGQRHPPQYSRL